MLQDYLKSFRLDERFWKTVIIDLAIFLLIFFLFMGFGKILNNVAYSISDGKDAAQLKLELLSGDIERNQEFVSSLKWFTFVLLAGGTTVILLTLFLFSLGQSYIWSTLQQQKFSFKRYWRWNGLMLVLFILFILYFLFYYLIRTLIDALITFSNDTAYALSTAIVNSFFLMIFVIFTFVLFFTFSQHYRVWESLGKTSAMIRMHWNVLWKYYILVAFTGFLVSIVLYFLQKQLYLQSPWLGIGINLVLFFLYLGWARMFLCRILKNVEDKSNGR